MAASTFVSFYLLFFVKKYKSEIVCPANSWKAATVVAGQDKYMDTTSYLIKTKKP